MQTCQDGPIYPIVSYAKNVESKGVNNEKNYTKTRILETILA